MIKLIDLLSNPFVFVTPLLRVFQIHFLFQKKIPLTFTKSPLPILPALIF